MTLQDLQKIITQASTAQDLAALSPSQSLRKQGLDSMDMAVLFLTIEEALGIKFSTNDLSRLESIDQILNELNQRGCRGI